MTELSFLTLSFAFVQGADVLEATGGLSQSLAEHYGVSWEADERLSSDEDDSSVVDDAE